LEELFLYKNGYWDADGAHKYLMTYAKMKNGLIYVPDIYK